MPGRIAQHGNDRRIQLAFLGQPVVQFTTTWRRRTTGPHAPASSAVTQALLVEGRHRVRVYAPGGDAPAGFEEVAPSLEDAYLVLMRTELGLESGAAARAAAGNGGEGKPGREAEALSGVRP